MNKRDDILSRQYRPASGPETGENVKCEDDVSGTQKSPTSGALSTAPRTHHDTSGGGGESGARDGGGGLGQPHSSDLADQTGEPPLHVPPLKLKIERKPLSPSPALDPSPTVVGTPTGGNGQHQTSYSADSERSSGPLSLATPQANHLRPDLPISPVSTPPAPGITSTRLDYDMYESGLEPVHPDDVPSIFKRGHPSRPQSGLAKVPEEPPTHHFPPSPPPLSPTPDAENAPEVAYSQTTTHMPPPSDDTISVASTSKKSRRARMFSLADMGIRFGGKSSPKGAADGAATKIPKDLEFVFSATGSVLVFYARKDLGYLTKIAAPFRRADRFDLSERLGKDKAAPAGMSPRLVAAGDHSVAAFVVEGDTARLSHWDRTGEMCQVPFSPYPGVVPSALAVSRDDTRVVLACGREVFLYSRLYGRMCLEANLSAHSKTAQYTAPGRPIQRVNFSVDSKKLIISTQENEAGTKKPVYVSIYDCFGSREVRLDRELAPVHLNLVSGHRSKPFGSDISDALTRGHATGLRI